MFLYCLILLLLLDNDIQIKISKLWVELQNLNDLDNVTNFGNVIWLDFVSQAWREFKYQNHSQLY